MVGSLKDVWVLLKRIDNGYFLPSGIIKSHRPPDDRFDFDCGSGWVDAIGLTGFTLTPHNGMLRCQKTGALWTIPVEYVDKPVTKIDPESNHVPLPSLHPAPDPSRVRRVSPAHGIGVMWRGGLETGRLFDGGL